MDGLIPTLKNLELCICSHFKYLIAKILVYTFLILMEESTSMIANIALFLLVLLNRVFLFGIAIIWILYALLNNLEFETVLIVDFGYGVKVNPLLKVVTIWLSALIHHNARISFCLSKWKKQNFIYGTTIGLIFMILLQWNTRK